MENKVSLTKHSFDGKAQFLRKSLAFMTNEVCLKNKPSLIKLNLFIKQSQVKNTSFYTKGQNRVLKFTASKNLSKIFFDKASF
ncbi:hypothetical protein DMC01_08390 [Campylobacter troglodytis]|nr:hypothetical protein DMC01_08390 [Campylobacter troglodytis]